jgi:hypothetical protein
MVQLKLLPNGVSFEGHSQNSKACKALTVIFHLFVDIFESEVNLISDLPRNYFHIITSNQKAITIMHKYLKLLSPIWSTNEITLIDNIPKRFNGLTL